MASASVKLDWDTALQLPVVRRLGRLVRRRFGAELGGAGPTAPTEDGATPAGGGARCAERALAATVHATDLVAFPCHEGWSELAAPVRVDGEHVGCVFARARPDTDLDLLGELLVACAEAIAVHADGLPRVAAPAPPSGASPDGPGPRRVYEGLIGRTRPIRDLCRLLDKVVESESTVLIQGENGTGKELIARAVHHHSRRARERFVVQNCSAFNDNLLDSELFGHKRGSFTGAIADKPGLFEIADRGTFFLDEVGDMSPALQVKLLRVLQEGTFVPVGDTVTRRTDVRIIAATHRDLKKMVERGEFREDLYYRINVITIAVPALRERRDDIPLLVDHFLRTFGRVRPKKLTRACLDRLVEYAWPGNVRELENEIERLVVLSGDEPVIDEPLLSPRIRRAATAPGPEAEPSLPAGSLSDAMDTLERDLIHEVLKRTHWNKTRAAQQLRISRRNLIRKVDKYKLERK